MSPAARPRKKYILETTGNGIGVFDSDNDGLLDVYVANGTTLDGDGRAQRRPDICIGTSGR